MIILASASPRRKELFSIIQKDFKILPANIEEVLPDTIPTEQAAEFLSVQKAKAVSQEYPKDTVIGCDTAVICDGEILGKPKDSEDAKRMLQLLSGKTHQVITGCAIFKNGKSISFSEITEVSFFPLSEKEIDDYIATNEPFDKAGAYGIQGYGSLLVEKINGEYFNVVGLPVSKLNKILKKI